MLSTFQIDWVEHAIEQAMKWGASDIHIEPSQRGYEVRMRKDGDLQPVSDLLPCDASAVQRIKVLAEMDIAERRLPQDGSFRVQTEQGNLDIRVASLPTVLGEKLVLRLLRHDLQFQDLADLQMDPETEQAIRRLLLQATGMLIVTGPTGSGKTTTLLSALHFLKESPLNIVTLEDPVESRIAGISQVQINERAGLTFAKGLRSILRQDPDVIMVGEIRDGETAAIAVRAALTGHLVLTTLHTETKQGALVRLVDLGVEPYLVGAAVNGVLAQRLVKKQVGDGRRAIFDWLPITKDVQEWLLTGASPIHLPSSLAADRLQQRLRELIQAGEISASEYEKISGGDWACLQAARGGQMTADSHDFLQDWQASYAADLLSTQA